VTLGNQSSIRRLVLQGAASNIQEDADDLGGNVVVVASRGRELRGVA
jgi:hypothetical protein